MVGSRDPAGIIAPHPLISHQDILENIIQGMAHMKGAGDIGRRDDYGKGLSLSIHFSMEVAPFHPVSIPLLFNFPWLIPS